MLDAFQIIDALAAAFFCLIGIWAAVARRHWFLRFAVASCFLLATLLVSANEVAIEFAIQIGLLTTVVWLTRQRGRWQWKFSVETALLSMVVVAISAAVLGQTRELSLAQWLALLGTGVGTAAYGLLCLWLVFGRAELRYRLPAALVALALCFALHHFFSCAQSALLVMNAGGDWQSRMVQLFSFEAVTEWGQRILPVLALGTIMVTATLVCAKYSRWFGESESEDRQPVTFWPTKVSRVGLVLVVLAIASPLATLFYRMMTPTQLPVVAVEGPNGYDDVVAAGKLLGDDVNQLIRTSNQWPEDRFRRELQKLATPIHQIETSLDRPNFQPRFGDADSAEMAVVRNAIDSLMLEHNFIRRFGTTPEKIDWAVKSLHLSNAIAGGSRVDWTRNAAFWILSQSVASLSAEQCRKLLIEINRYDQGFQSLEDYLRAIRVERERRGWRQHVGLILNEWSGREPLAAFEQQHVRRHAVVRTLIAQLALQAYYLERKQLPGELQELVPEYMLRVPANPQTLQPITYRRTKSGFSLECLDPKNSRGHRVTGPAKPRTKQRATVPRP